MRVLSNADEVVLTLGGNTKVARHFGFRPSAVSNWRKNKRFPADTFTVFRKLLAVKECKASEDLWRMRKQKRRGNGHARKAR